MKSHYGCQSKNTQSQVTVNSAKSYTCTCVHFFPEFIGFTNKVCIWTESADKAGLSAVEDRWPWSGEQRTKRPSVRDRGGKGQDRGNSGESAEKCQAVQAKTEGQPGTNW